MKQLVLSVSAAALAVTSAWGATINEIAELQAQLEKAEIQSKINRRSITKEEIMQVNSKKQHEPVILLKGIYGISDRLRAIVTIDGAEVEFAAHDIRMGFRAKQVDADEVVLVKTDKRGNDKNGKVYRLYLTGSDNTVNTTLPPIPPIPPVPQYPAPGSPLPGGNF